MPPKKKGAAASKTKAKATQPTPSPSGRAIDPTPAFVTTNRGKEYETTAAAARPRRDATAPEAPDPSPKKKPTPATKKRAPPAESTFSEEPPAKRGRKAADTANEQPDSAPQKRGPGRQPNKSTAAAAAKATPAASTGQKRGRSAKADVVEEDALEELPPPKKRGRPARASTAAVEKDASEEAPPRKRGRPPTGGETTKISADDEAAAEQLEDELMDDAEEATPKKPTAAKKGKEKARHVDDEEPTAVDGGKQYWLMKAEQDGHDVKLKNGSTFNTAFTIDDLRSKTQPEPWDGVRSPAAAKNMRAMKKGDLAFFYASGEKSGRKPGIVGIMEIVSEHEPDATAADENSAGFVEKEKDRSKWCVVHVEFRKKLVKPVLRSELLKYTKEGGVLSKMEEYKAARLSVSKVSPNEWDFIINNLVEGYVKNEPTAEGEVLVSGVLNDVANEEVATNAVEEEQRVMTISQEINGDVTVEESTTTKDTGLPASEALETASLPTMEVQEALLTDGLADASSATVPISRAPSHQPSAGEKPA